MTRFTPHRYARFTGALLFTLSALVAPPALAASPEPQNDTSSPVVDLATAAPSPAIATAEIAKGLVEIQLNHRSIAVGVVLANDGRVLTSLVGKKYDSSTLFTLKYSDGHTRSARIGHFNQELVLLVPNSASWKSGLEASSGDPLKTTVRAAIPTTGGVKPVFARIIARGEPVANTLNGPFIVQSNGGALPSGAPLLDSEGRIVAIAGVRCSKCAPNESLVTLTHQARLFLQSTPASAVIPTPWLGIGGISISVSDLKTKSERRGVRVSAILPGSPAEKAGLMAGDSTETADVILSVDENAVETPDELAKSLGNRAVGDKVKLNVLRKGATKEFVVTLTAAPTT